MVTAAAAPTGGTAAKVKVATDGEAELRRTSMGIAQRNWNDSGKIRRLALSLARRNSSEGKERTIRYRMRVGG